MDVMTQYPQHPAGFSQGPLPLTWADAQQQQQQQNYSVATSQNSFEIAELMKRQFELTAQAAAYAQQQHHLAPPKEEFVPQILAEDYQMVYGSSPLLSVNTGVPYAGQYGDTHSPIMSTNSSSPSNSPSASHSAMFSGSSPGLLPMPVNPFTSNGWISPAHSLPGTPLPSHASLPDQNFPGFAVNGMVGAVNVATGQHQLTRTVYVGNLPNDASVDELLSLVRFGPIENVKIIAEKSCAFISFLDPTIASAFHSDVIMRKVALHGQELRVGWGKPSPVLPQVLMAVQQHGACRNVFVGNLDETTTEASLRDELSVYGPIDQVKIVRDKNIGFIHFLSIVTAMKVVATLLGEPGWHDKRVNYGKDRCAYVPKNQHQQQQHNMQAAAMAANATGNFGALSASINPMGLPVTSNATQGVNNDFLAQAGNRTIYLGNLHPDTAIEEVCNCIRGGVLQQIRYIKEKHICFITFVDPNAALAFIGTSLAQGLTIHNRRLKIGYGKHSGPAPAGIALCVQAGGSRNVYIGGVEDLETYTVDKLKTDFGQYGEIEMVNILKDKNCGFVNFTDIANAIKAIEGIKKNPEYSAFKIAYGKDRCGNMPRTPYQRRNTQRSNEGEIESQSMEDVLASVDAEDRLRS